MASRKSWGTGNIERYVQGELYEVLGRGKKAQKSNPSNRNIRRKSRWKNAVEKKPNDFESTDADRITCKGTHYFMGA